MALLYVISIQYKHVHVLFLLMNGEFGMSCSSLALFRVAIFECLCDAAVDAMLFVVGECL